MQVVDLIKFLRQSVLVQDGTVTPINPAYLTMSDEDITLLLNVALFKVQPTANSLDTMDNIYTYPLILVAKKELFYRLALPTAQQYRIMANRSSLEKDQIFTHYMSMIGDIDKEYSEYLATGIPISSANVYLDSRYYTKRNYDNATAPVASLVATVLYQDKVELNWQLSKVSRFHCYKLYQGTVSNIDSYSKEHNNLILPSAILVDTLYDIHQNFYRVEGLLLNTNYFMTLVVQEWNGLKGYSEIPVTTLS